MLLGAGQQPASSGVQLAPPESYAIWGTAIAACGDELGAGVEAVWNPHQQANTVHLAIAGKKDGYQWGIRQPSGGCIFQARRTGRLEEQVPKSKILKTGRVQPRDAEERNLYFVK